MGRATYWFLAIVAVISMCGAHGKPAKRDGLTDIERTELLVLRDLLVEEQKREFDAPPSDDGTAPPPPPPPAPVDGGNTDTAADSPATGTEPSEDNQDPPSTGPDDTASDDETEDGEPDIVDAETGDTEEGNTGEKSSASEKGGEKNSESEEKGNSKKSGDKGLKELLSLAAEGKNDEVLAKAAELKAAVEAKIGKLEGVKEKIEEEGKKKLNKLEQDIKQSTKKIDVLDAISNAAQSDTDSLAEFIESIIKPQTEDVNKSKDKNTADEQPPTEPSGDTPSADDEEPDVNTENGEARELLRTLELLEKLNSKLKR